MTTVVNPKRLYTHQLVQKSNGRIHITRPFSNKTLCGLRLSLDYEFYVVNKSDCKRCKLVLAYHVWIDEYERLTGERPIELLTSTGMYPYPG